MKDELSIYKAAATEEEDGREGVGRGEYYLKQLVFSIPQKVREDKLTLSQS